MRENHCQVYTGLSRIHKRSSQAVRDTHGQLLFDAEGLVDTTYSSTCRVTASHFIWSGAANLRLPILAKR